MQNIGSKCKFAFLLLMMHKSREKRNKEKTPLVTINSRESCFKNHTDQAVMDQM